MRKKMLSCVFDVLIPICKVNAASWEVPRKGGGPNLVLPFNSPSGCEPRLVGCE
jgi:hypothetical protein